MKVFLAVLVAACSLAWVSACGAQQPTATVFDQTCILDGGLPRDAFYGSDTNTWDSDQSGVLPYAGNFAAHFTPYPHNDSRNGGTAIGATSASYGLGHPFLYAKDFSIEAWVKLDPAAVSAGSSSTIFNTRRFGFAVTEGGLNPHFVTYGRKDWILGSVSLQVNAWYQLVVTYSGDTATFYVNGAPAGSVIDAGQTGANTSSWTHFAIAHRTDANLGVTWFNPYFGWIDELAIFPVILTDAQVLAHYNARNGNYPAAVLADEPSGYWDFNKARRPKAKGGTLLIVR
jgi:hypothetical protein